MCSDFKVTLRFSRFLHLAASLLLLFCLLSCSAFPRLGVKPTAPTAGQSPEPVASDTPIAQKPRSETPASLPTLPATPIPTQLPTITLTLEQAETATPLPTISPTPTIYVSPLACLPSDRDISKDEYGIVRWVPDGDSIVVDVRGQWVSVRYLGIDVPPYIPNIRSGGPPAARRNEELVLNRVVRMIRDGRDRDRFGELLRYVLVDDLFMNDVLIREGWAKFDPDRSEIRCASTFQQAEAEAMQTQRGMWSPIAIAAAMTKTPTPTRTPRLPTSTATQGMLLFTPTATQILLPSSTWTPATPGTTSSPAAGTPTVTGTPTTTATQSTPGTPTMTFTPTPTFSFVGVLISEIHYLGDPAKAEADEYVRILNNSTQAVNLTDWILNENEKEIDFYFPDMTLQPGQSCRIYTNELHEDSCGGVSWESIDPVWDNNTDCGYLFDAEGVQVGEPYCYQH